MEETQRRIWSMELLGIPFIVMLGSLLHFVFAWSDYWTPVALIAAVNESVWEHLKLAFWPGIAWAFIEYTVLRPKVWPFWAAKGIGLLIAPLLITLIFYTYTAFLGRNLLLLDISTFVIAIIAGQIGTAILINSCNWNKLFMTVGSGILVCQLMAYSTFTFYPLTASIFEDSRTGIRGIPVLRQKSDG